jgi:CheY-like chemotaxis protein
MARQAGDESMLTHATSTTMSTPAQPSVARATQKVLIVNGDSDVLEVLEPVLEAGNYDIVFVEASAHAYSQIRRVQPHLVILCLRIDDAEGFQVLSMLKLDPDTRSIPVVTYTAPARAAVEAPDEDDDEDADPPMFTARPALLMN